MAYNWHDDEYGFHGNATQPSLWLHLRNYEGPYDPDALMRARDELLYHFECTQNTAAWERILTVTPVNINGIRGDDDGFGEASNIYSHAKLPENEEYEEPYQGRQIDNNSLVPLSIKVHAQQEPISAVTREEDLEKIKEVDYDDDGCHEFGMKIVSKEMDTSTIEINVAVTSENADYGHNTNSLGVEKNNDLTKDEQTEMPNENIIPADVGDGLECEETDKENIENSMFESSYDEDQESDKNEVSNEVENITIETNTYDSSGSSTKMLSKNKEEMDEQENLSKPVPYSENVLKCDHCELRCSDKKSMRKHLESVVHYSASKYNVDDAGKLMLIKKMVITNMKAKFKTTVMKCPVASCQAIFPQMDACVNHFNRKHWKKGMPKSQYALIDIVTEKECCISMNPPQCCLCSMTFKTVFGLRKHLEKRHFPFTLKYKRFFLCQYCEKSFRRLDGLICHQELHRNRTGINEVISFRVFQYENIRKFSISPSGRLSCLDGSLASPPRKRKHEQVFLDNEPNMKVTKTEDRIGDEVKSSNDVEEGVNGEDVSTNVKDVWALNNTDAVRNADNHTKSVLSAVWSESDCQNVGGADELQNTFKCDFCSKIKHSKEQMISHLNEKCHRSASPVLIDTDKNVQYMKELSSISCDHGHHQKIYTTCSENCRSLFSTVRESIEHHIMHHNYDTDTKPYYGVVKVKDEIILKVSLNTCIVCGESFQKLKLLSTHYKENHYPFSSRHKHDIFFGCVYCPRLSYKFKHALSHLEVHQMSEETGMFDVTVLYVERKIKKIELLPKHSRNADRREEEIKNIKYRLNDLETSSRSIIDKAARTKMKKAIRAVKRSLVQILC